MTPDEHSLIIHDEPATPFLDHARKVGAGQGVSWLTDGLRLFASAPGRWLLVIVISLLLYIALSLVPLLGWLLNLLSAPLLLAGVMSFAHGLDTRGDRSISQLFDGFRQQAGRLTLLGLFYLLLFLGAVFLTVLAALLLGIDQLPREGVPMSPEQLMRVLGLILLFVTLILPVTMAYWFAPALVFFSGLTPWQALRSSLVATLRNWLPLLVYGLGLVLVLLISMLPLLLLSLFSGDTAVLLMVPLWMLLALCSYVFCMTSLYRSFKGLFGTHD